MLFSPLFFASIGIKTNLEGLTSTMAIFAVVLTIVAILTKIIGCGIGARIMGFHTYDAFSIGLGMVSRGEVALIVAQKGEQAGLIDPHMFPADCTGRYRYYAGNADSAQARHEQADPGKHGVQCTGKGADAQGKPALKIEN